MSDAGRVVGEHLAALVAESAGLREVPVTVRQGGRVESVSVPPPSARARRLLASSSGSSAAAVVGPPVGSSAARLVPSHRLRAHRSVPMPSARRLQAAADAELLDLEGAASLGPETPAATQARGPAAPSSDEGRDEAADAERRRAQFFAFPVFAGVAPAVVAELYQAGRVERRAVGQLVYGARERDLDVWVLLCGAALQRHAAPDGRALATEIRSAPALIGHTELLAENSAVGSIEVLEKSELVRVPAAVFALAIRRSPVLVHNLLVEQARRLITSIRQQEALAFDPIEARLAGLLQTYAEKYGTPVKDGIKIRLVLSQEGLANTLGVNVRSIRRAMSRWLVDGILHRRGGYTILAKPAALGALVSATAA
ncbi:MAG: Crp/Fnr family transcriptional regulator [Deltaproteobacteria bacterium]|nr:Crp/Fnr family transcriptional regulator [Deltaproteobacteria bacterium]